MNTKRDRVALVTGASSGIGEAIARRLAADGFRVFGASRNAADSVGAAVEPVALDVTDEARRLLETNLLGVHRVTRAAVPHLHASRGYAIIIGSIAG